MDMTVGQIFDRTLTLTAIINEKRPMPQRGKFLLARLHAKLLPEFNIAAVERDKLIEEYGHREPDTDQMSVPVEKMPEFAEKWKVIADMVVDVDVKPIALADLELVGTNGGIEAHEMVTLGELISE